MVKQYMFFWRGWLSQWTASPFVVDDRMFFTAEHWMIWNKAMVFNDLETADQIMIIHNPSNIQKLDQRIKNYDDNKWMNHAYDIVVEGNYHKFFHHKMLQDRLQNTIGKYLVNANPNDCRWGVGLYEYDKAILDENNWKGENLLGKALMDVRDRLFNSEKKINKYY